MMNKIHKFVNIINIMAVCDINKSKNDESKTENEKIGKLLNEYLKTEIGNDDRERQVFSLFFLKYYDLYLKQIVAKTLVTKPKKPRSEKQINASNKIKQISQLWRGLSETEKQTWKDQSIEYNKQFNKKANGYNRFFSATYKTLK